MQPTAAVPATVAITWRRLGARRGIAEVWHTDCQPLPLMTLGRGIDETAADALQVRVPLAEERISVEKRTREIGQVLLQRAVTEEQQTVAMDVGRETLRVTRRTAPPRPAAPDEVEAAFAAGVVRIPVFGEAAAALKRAYVTGEVVVHRRQVVESRLFTETVRREAAETEMARPDAERVRGPMDETAVTPRAVVREPVRDTVTDDTRPNEGTTGRSEGLPLVRPAALWREVREGWSRGRSRT